VSSARRTRRRSALVVFALLAVVAVFVVRLVDLQVVQADTLNAAAEGNRSIEVTTYGKRGDIVDTNGAVLATTTDRFDITASPKVSLGATWIDTRDDAIAQLAEVLQIDPAAVRGQLDADPESDYVVLAKKVELEVRDRVVDLGIGWIYPQVNQARTYPVGAIGGSLVGFLGTDGPQAGLEYSENACVASENGSQTYERSADSVRLPGSTVTTKAATDGGTLRLTIDIDLQWFAQQAIAEQAEAIQAKWATAMVVRVKDGHVMAAADYPTYDPNNIDGYIRKYGADSLRAIAFAETYEPGSTFKPMTAAMLFDQGVADQLTPVSVPSAFTTEGGGTILDVFSHPTMNWTTTGIIVNSSNIGISELTKRLSPKARYGYLRSFGLGEETAVHFSGEGSGLLDPYEDWDSIQRYAVSFGQGISVTSAQVAGIYQTLGNYGLRKPLTLVEGCEAPDGTVTHTNDGKGKRVVSEAAASDVIEMMENFTTQGGLSSIITIPGYNIAAKTGTAQVAREDGIGYGAERVVSVAGLIPGDAPEYAVVVTYGEPVTMKTSAAAAPTFVKIMNQLIKTYRITPSKSDVPELPVEW
jgi:cell division protein FtsI (penicillin-binding protein 3)